MTEKLNYTQKCYLLLAGLLLFFVIGYRFSFADTFELKNSIREKEEKLQWLKDKEKELPALKAKMAEFDKAYSKSDSIAIRDRLTAYISDYAEHHHCLVTEIPANVFFKSDKLQVQTNTFTIKGGFHELLVLLHQLGSDYKYLCRIMSARFFTISDLQTKKKSLYLTVITQSFEQKNR